MRMAMRGKDSASSAPVLSGFLGSGHGDTLPPREIECVTARRKIDLPFLGITYPCTDGSTERRQKGTIRRTMAMDTMTQEKRFARRCSKLFVT